MQEILKSLLEKISSRKFILTVVTFLLFVFSDQLNLSPETKAQLLVAFLGYIGVEGGKDIITELKK